MDIIVVTPRFNGDKFDLMLGPSLTNINTKCVNVSDKEGGDLNSKTISYKYNIGIDVAKQNNLITDNTIVIFCKDDVNIADPNAVAKIEYVFSTMPNIGMVGVKGVKHLNPSVDLYHIDNVPLNGIVYNVKEHQVGEYIGTDKKGFFTDIVAVDDSIIIVRGSLLKHIDKFFSMAINNGFGIDASIQVLKMGYDIGVIDMFVISNSYSSYDFTVVSDVCFNLNLELPVSFDNLNLSSNFVVDVEL